MNGKPEQMPKSRILVLLVEDDAVDRIACRRALQQHPDYDFEVVEADTGRQGLQLVSQRKFDCILLDYHLPDMSGLDFLADMADAEGNIQVPVLKLTGSDDVAIAVEAMKLGARDYLIKDTKGRYLELLPAVVERVLGEQLVLEEKRYAEEKYRQLVEHLPSITYVMSLEEMGRMVFVSPQIEKLGFDAADWIESADFHSQRTHLDDRLKVIKALENSLHTGDPFHCDYRLITRDGKIRWFHDEAAVVCDNSGKMVLLQGFMLDVSESKAMEEELTEHRYRLEERVAWSTEIMQRRISVLESANARLCELVNQYENKLRQAKSDQFPQVFQALAEDAVILTDRGGYVVFLNPVAEQLLNVDFEKALRRPLVEVLPLVGPDGLDVQELLHRCLTQELEKIHFESATLLRKEGGAIEVFGWCTPIVHADGQVTCLLVVLAPAARIVPIGEST